MHEIPPELLAHMADAERGLVTGDVALSTVRGLLDGILGMRLAITRDDVHA